MEQHDLVTACELHSVESLEALLEGGLDPREPVRGKLPIDWLTEMYTRSDHFPACLRLLLDYGAVLADPRLEAVLLDDAPTLAAALDADPSLLTHRTTMVSAFTPLIGASLLHVAAEFGNGRAARVLLDRGADADARAAVDAHGLNGQTPLFHTVNSHANRNAGILEMLLDAGADSTLRLEGITWGAGFEWETTLFDVTPIAYAQFGLLPQIHRKEADIYATSSACYAPRAGRFHRSATSRTATCDSRLVPGAGYRRIDDGDVLHLELRLGEPEAGREPHPLDLVLLGHVAVVLDDPAAVLVEVLLVDALGTSGIEGNGGEGDEAAE
jgi:hypothetical protein